MTNEKVLEKKRLLTVAIALLLVGSILPMLFTPVEGATPENKPDKAIAINDIIGSMEDTGEPHPDDATVGETYVAFDLELYAQAAPAGTNVTSVVYSEQPTKLDEDVDYEDATGDDWSEPEVDPIDDWSWDTNEMTEGYYNSSHPGNNPYFWVGNYFEDKSWSYFNVSTEAEPGIYNMSVTMNFEREGDTWTSEELTQHFTFMISRNAEVQDRTLQPPLEFEQRTITVANVGDQHLEHVNLTLNEDDLVDSDGTQVTIHNPDDTAYVDIIQWHPDPNIILSRDFNFQLTVPLDMDPGEYEVNYTLEATRADDEETVTEYGTLTITIEEIVELSAEIEDNEVTQGTPMENFTVTFTNTGNLDLERISVVPYTDEIEAGVDSPFSRPGEYYENFDPTMDEWFISLDEDLGVGESTTVGMTLGIDQDIQIGEHKLNFMYEAYYYDHLGEITGEEEYVEIYDYEAVGMGSHWLVADTDEPYAWVEVTEPEVPIDLTVSNLDTVRITDTGYQEISIRLENQGRVEYSDVNLKLHTEGTPFIHPEDEDMETIEMLDEPFTLGTGYTEEGPDDYIREVRFGVVVDSEFVEERLAEDRPIYTAEFTFEGTNDDLLTEVEYSLNANGEVRGIGPKIMLRQVDGGNEVTVGESFELTYELENIGDEPIRDLEVMIEPHIPEVGTTFEDGQEAVYYRQASTPPGPYVGTVEPADQTLEPGENTTVTFHMKPSSDMQEGSIYFYSLTIQGEAQEGERTWDSFSTIRTEEGDSTKPMLTTPLSYILVALIIGIAFVVGLYVYKRKPKSKKPEEEKLEEEEPEFEEKLEEEPSEPDETKEDFEEVEEAPPLEEEISEVEEPEEEEW